MSRKIKFRFKRIISTTRLVYSRYIINLSIVSVNDFILFSKTSHPNYTHINLIIWHVPNTLRKEKPEKYQHLADHKSITMSLYQMLKHVWYIDILGEYGFCYCWKKSLYLPNRLIFISMSLLLYKHRVLL